MNIDQYIEKYIEINEENNEGSSTVQGARAEGVR